MRFKCFLTGILLSMQIIVFAQDDCHLSVSGVVIDHHDRRPLEFTNILIKGTQRGAMSDSKGHYIIEHLCPGTYTFIFSHLGCEPIEVEMEVNRDVVREVYLEHHEELLEQVVIQGLHKETTTSLSVVKLDDQVLREASGKLIGEVLEGISGVNVLKTGPNIIKPIIHGLHSNRIAIINNGVKMEGQQWGSEHAPSVNTFLLSDISVVKGAAGVRYGSDAVGGLIVMKPGLVPVEDGLNGSVGISGEMNGRGGQLSLGLASSIKRLEFSGWAIKASAKRSGDRRSPDYFLNNTGVREIATSIDWGIRKWKWGVDVYFSQFNENKGILKQADFSNVIDESTAGPFSYAIATPRQLLDHYLGKVSGYYRLKKLGKLNMNYSFQKDLRQEFDNRRSTDDNIPILHMDLRTHNGELIVEQHPVRRLRGQFGLQGNFQFNYNVPGTGVNPLIPNYKRYRSGIFTIQKLKYDSSEIEFGFRYDYQFMNVKRIPGGSQIVVESTHQYHQFAGLIGITYELNEWARINTNVGSGFKPPGVNELFSDGLHHGSRVYEEGNPDLGPETSVKWVGSLSLTPWNGRLKLDATGHFNFVYNYIYLYPTGDTVLAISGIFPRFRYIQENVSISGLDIDLSVTLFSDFYFNGQLAMVRGNIFGTGEPLIYMPSDRYKLGWSYIRKDWGATTLFRAGMNWSWVSRQKRFVPNVDFLDPPPAYHTMQVFISTEIKLKQGRRLGLGVSADNICNTRYKEYLDYFRYYAFNTGAELNLHLEFIF
ncbi:MAG: TonB-dependent receptor [Bacteroidetes bacterium]|nr:TonB-dependent receptor [Bacteroidota bacterium]